MIIKNITNPLSIVVSLLILSVTFLITIKMVSHKKE